MQGKYLGYLLVWIAGISIGMSSSVYAITFDKIIVFGDSLSDNGNVFSFTSAAHQAVPSIPIIPKEPPYYQGHFSNGQTWIENLAQVLNVPLDDYAYGGAWAESVFDSKRLFPFGLGMQVNFYLMQALHDYNRSKHLYVIWVGSNDYIDGRSDVEYATSNTIAAIKSQIDLLMYYGAKKILLLNLPDLSVTPDAIQRGTAFVESVAQLTQLHNDKFIKMIANLKKEYPSSKFFSLNIADYFNEMMKHPDEFQLKNIKDACYNNNYYSRADYLNKKEIQAAEQAHIDIMHHASLRIAYLTSRFISLGQQPCSHPDEYLFWDPIHPTRVIHQLLMGYALRLLERS